LISVLLTVCAVVSGAAGGEVVEDFGCEKFGTRTRGHHGTIPQAQIPKLLELLELERAIVSRDALGAVSVPLPNRFVTKAKTFAHTVRGHWGGTACTGVSM